MAVLYPVVTRALAKYKLTLIDVAKQPEYAEQCGMDLDYFHERSSVCHPEVIVGMYQCRERRALSILHEIGHLRHPKVNALSRTPIVDEAYAWRWAVRQIRRHWRFKIDTITWCIDQLRTYDNEESNPDGLSDDAFVGLSELPTLRIRT